MAVRRIRTGMEACRGSFRYCCLSAWCGLVSGLFEVGMIVLCKQVLDSNHLYRMSRHFIWLIPLANLCVFLTLGLCGSASFCFGGRGVGCSRADSVALVMLALVLVAFPRVYTLAWLVVASVWPFGSFRSSSACPCFRRFILVAFPRPSRGVAILGGSLWVGDRLKEAREVRGPCRRRGRPMSS